MSLFDEHQDEGFKAACHGATLTLGALLCAYNTKVAQSARGQGWHRFSAVTYALLCGLELIQIGRHLGGHR